ncbi:MAG: tRNA (5-methylaminomethyl-2-thiouridine)(34)-methyltransferase MnmD [Cyclobacteriaceae bacterium]|nr:tRNA (5-methylaminomethyl-2-thiouridine)(34)-methyltransferase MnmD [Cyclobacteriaceae bacterium]
MDELIVIHTEDGSTSLFHSGLQETYHSVYGAIQESQHVFIEAGLWHLCQVTSRQNVSILEVGFGTGLNALLTALAAEKMAVAIEYETIEAFPLAMEMVGLLNYPAIIGTNNAKSIFESLHQADWNKPKKISPYFDFLKRDSRLQETDFAFEKFDLIFFDAFAPDKQPDMWERSNLIRLEEAMKPQGVFVTYSAKGQLKRDLVSLGLLVEKIPGPLGKREMIRATKP